MSESRDKHPKPIDSLPNPSLIITITKTEEMVYISELRRVDPGVPEVHVRGGVIFALSKPSLRGHFWNTKIKGTGNGHLSVTHAKDVHRIAT